MISAMNELRTGNPLSCQAPEAAHLYQQGVDLILGSQTGAAEALDKALQLDDQFAMAAAARYLIAKDDKDPKAAYFKEVAVRTAAAASEWEQQHVAVLIGLLDSPSDTIAAARFYIGSTPGDLLVLSQLVGYLFFYAGPGKLSAVLELLESVEDTLADDWAYLVRLGFAASEAGDRKRGRELILRALEIRPEALYSIHALAHVLHDEGAVNESTQLLNQWLGEHESGARGGQMYGHVQWHLALAEWQSGEREAAIKRYLTYCAPSTTTCGPILTLADCGGFLLRDYLVSGQAKALPADVLNHIEQVWGMVAHPFIALHVAGLYASAGDIAGLNRCKEVIVGASPGPNQEAALSIVTALMHYVDGDYLKSCQVLGTISPDSRIGIGGSHVERELVELIEQACQARL